MIYLLIELSMLGLCGRCTSYHVVAHRGLSDVLCSALWQAPLQPCVQYRIMS